MSRWLTVLLWMYASQAAAYYGSESPLHPADYLAPGSDLRWHVDPSDRNGAGEARYTLYRGSVRVLERTLEYTLREAQVGDDGSLAGYAYTQGDGIDGGELVISLLGSDGEARVLAREPREPSRYLHTPANPRVLGMHLQRELQLLVVRVADPDVNRGLESWWTYALPDGKPLGRPEPRLRQADNASLLGIRHARPIAGTPLILVQWQVGSPKPGTRHQLLDADLKPVWSLDEFAANLDARERRRIDRDGSVLGHGDRRFVLWFAQTRERVEFQVQADGEAWRVLELQRRPAPAPFAPAREVPPPSEPLGLLGRIQLGDAEAGGIGRFVDFGIDGQGRFGLLRCDCGQPAGFALVDRDGTLLREIALPMLGEHRAQLAWLDGDRWLVVHADQRRTFGHWIDAAAGRVDPIAGFAPPPVTALARDPTGGFVVLTQLFASSTVDSTLRAFDANARERWVVEEDYSERDGIFSAEDVAVGNDGTVTVLENVPRKLARFDGNGQALGRIDLEVAWGKKPNYPAGLHPDNGDGVVVFDFQGDPEVVHMGADGSVGARYTPTLESGQRFRAVGDVQVSPDGSRWTSDGGALMRLREDGIATEVLGQRAEGHRLETITAMHVSRDGTNHAVDERSGAVHVHDAAGRRLRVCLPATGDFSSALSMPGLAVGDDGSVYLEREDARPADHLHFSPACERLGTRAMPGAGLFEEWVAQAGSDRMFVLGGDTVTLHTADGQRLQEQERDSLGRWLHEPQLGAAAADGSLLVHAGANSIQDRDDPALATSLVLFDAAGKPRRQWPAPRALAQWSNLAWDGERVAYVAEIAVRKFAVHLLDTGSGRTVEVVPASADYRRVWFVDTEGSRELWVWDGKREVQRYALR